MKSLLLLVGYSESLPKRLAHQPPDTILPDHDTVSVNVPRCSFSSTRRRFQSLMSRLSAPSLSLSILVLASIPAFLSGCSDGGEVPFGSTGGAGAAPINAGSGGEGTTEGSGGGAPMNVGGTFVAGPNTGGGPPSGGGPPAGGGPPSGGGPQSGGAPASICMVGDPASTQAEVIDDMEAAVSGWFASNDGATPQTPSAGSFAAGSGLEGPGAAGSATALHSTANVADGAEWGATVQFDFGETRDASQWDGVKFWAKGSGSPRFNLVTADTLPPDGGGTCSGECYDSHGTRISLGADWTEIKVYFSDVRQEGFGTAVDFNPASLMAFALQTKAAGNYDMWIDNLSFFSEQGMPDCVNYPGDSLCEATDAYCAECGEDPRCECVLSTCIETGVLEGPLSCNQQTMNTRQGGSTRYWINQASADRDTSGGYEALACGFPVVSKGNDQGSAASQDKVAGAPGDGTMFGALNSADFGTGASLCGACVLINESVKIQIVDECPNRPGAQGNPSCNSGHIDLSVAAANRVGGDNPGISWRVVECDNAEPEYYWHWDSTNFWGALSIVGLRYPAAKVELKDGSTWLEGKRKDYWGAWIFGQDEDIPGSSGSVPPSPWTVRITDIHGQVLQDKFSSPSGNIPNQVQNGQAVPYPSEGMIQLPVCSM